MLKFIKGRIDLPRIKIDKAQSLWRKSKFAAAREF